MSPFNTLIIIAVGLFLSAFYAGSETAVVSCSKVKLRHRAKWGSWRAQVLESFIRSPERFFAVVLVGTNISHIVCTAAATALAVSVLGSNGAVTATVVMTPLILIFGEVVPKSAFLYHADSIALIVSPLLKVLSYILLPLAMPATFLARFVLRLTRSPERRFNLLTSRGELIHLYRRGKEETDIERREHLIIDRVFNFGRVKTGDLVVPFSRVVSFPVTASVDEVIAEANKHTYSRFPILSPHDGHVIGIVSFFELLGLDGGEQLASVMKPPFFANENELAEKLFVRMKEEALHLAIVLSDEDEIRGILTLEDILESIVGDIASEHE